MRRPLGDAGESHIGIFFDKEVVFSFIGSQGWLACILGAYKWLAAKITKLQDLQGLCCERAPATLSH